MKLLAISEHYFPRVGGTVNYVHETLTTLCTLGVDVELWVPGPAPENWSPSEMGAPPYKIQWIDAGYPAKGDPSRDQRYGFCREVDKLALDRTKSRNPPDVLHVLFGLFVMEILDTATLETAGLACLATVHNVPPMECRQIAHTAPLLARTKEDLRLKVVSLKNAARLRRHRYSRYIVPSQQVQGLLEPIVGGRIRVIGHGHTSDLFKLMSPPPSREPHGPLRILTAGGYAPHKRQHVIPRIAKVLKETGLNFSWDVVGPADRVPGYFDSIEQDVKARGLASCVNLHKSRPFDALASLYDQANVYVQPSIEEGFCITALDAATAGLPVIGCKAGALPAIVQASGGVLVGNEPNMLADAIKGYAKRNQWPQFGAQSVNVQEKFSWQNAGKTLLSEYKGVAKFHTEASANKAIKDPQ